MNFGVNDDFKRIIEAAIKKDVTHLHQVATGWTNYVFIASFKNNKKLVFRFPRNTFFAKQLKKEEFFNKFIRRKISLKVPKIKVFLHNGRPFSCHCYIKGKPLTVAASSLNAKQVDNLVKSIARFVTKLQKIKVKNNQIKFKGKVLFLPLLSDFLQELSEVGELEYNLKKHNHLLKLESQEITLAHGDLNPGNILLNSKNKMIAVLDFAFVGLTSQYIDPARIIGRMPNSFKQPLQNAFNKKFKTPLNAHHINKLISMWDYVEEKYIEYIKQNHPDIVLPDM